MISRLSASTAPGDDLYLVTTSALWSSLARGSHYDSCAVLKKPTDVAALLGFRNTALTSTVPVSPSYALFALSTAFAVFTAACKTRPSPSTPTAVVAHRCDFGQRRGSVQRHVNCVFRS